MTRYVLSHTHTSGNRTYPGAESHPRHPDVGFPRVDFRLGATDAVVDYGASVEDRAWFMDRDLSRVLGSQETLSLPT